MAPAPSTWCSFGNPFSKNDKTATSSTLFSVIAQCAKHPCRGRCNGSSSNVLGGSVSDVVFVMGFFDPLFVEFCVILITDVLKNVFYYIKCF